MSITARYSLDPDRRQALFKVLGEHSPGIQWTIHRILAITLTVVVSMTLGAFMVALQPRTSVTIMVTLIGYFIFDKGAAFVENWWDRRHMKTGNAEQDEDLQYYEIDDARVTIGCGKIGVQYEWSWFESHQVIPDGIVLLCKGATNLIARDGFPDPEDWQAVLDIVADQVPARLQGTG